MATVPVRVVSCALAGMAARRTFASLLDENRKLRAQLKGVDATRRRAEQQVAALRGRLHQADAAATQQLRRKEAEWMAEYDRGVQALLKIIQHHESETAQLKAEVEKLRAAAAVVPPSITKMTRASQTENSRLVKAAPRGNTVRFAPNEDGSVSDKEESDPRAKIKLARMQHLFEQLQSAREYRADKIPHASTKGVDAEPIRDRGEHDPRRCVKDAILRRLRVHQTDLHENKSDNSKTTETQTEGIPVPLSAAKLQQDLEDRNRLLHERLTSQQSMLDQLLHTKLAHANANSEKRERGPLLNVPATTPGVVQGGADKSQIETSNKAELSVPAECLAPSVAVQIEPIVTERRPLSPPAA